jgi:hypothetical protein
MGLDAFGIKTKKNTPSNNNFMKNFLTKDKTSKSMGMITGKDLGVQEHIGAKKFDPNKTRPIKNQGFSKPIGGFWTSSINTKPNDWNDPEVGSTEWRTWMKNNWEDRFREDARKESMKLKPNPDAKIFQIANKKDLEDLYEKYPSNYKGFKREVDWEKASKDLDAINITQHGHYETRLPALSNYDSELDTYPWDAESTVWFKPAFKEIEDDKTSKQYFTPSNDSTEFTAAQKFGGKNIKRLKKLGSGRDRDVYALEPGKVLKIAKNPKGLIQNTGERDLDYLDQVKQYEAGKDYVVMQRADKPGKATTALLRPLKKFSQGDFDTHDEKLQEALQTAGLDDVRSFDTSYGDLKAKRNWGEIQGRPVIVDGGIFTADSLGHHKPVPTWAAQEWREVQTSRRAFRNKGAEERDWEQRPGRYASYEERLADFPIKDETSPDKRISDWDKMWQEIEVMQKEKKNPINKKAQALHEKQIVLANKNEELQKWKEQRTWRAKEPDIEEQANILLNKTPRQLEQELGIKKYEESDEDS